MFLGLRDWSSTEINENMTYPIVRKQLGKNGFTGSKDKLTTSDIEIEEVDIEDGLHSTSHNGDNLVGILVDVTVDPIEDIKTSIAAQGKEVVRCNGLGFTGFGDHEQLW